MDNNPDHIVTSNAGIFLKVDSLKQCLKEKARAEIRTRVGGSTVL